MSDFNTVLSDLKSMGSTLHREATAYRKLHPDVTPDLADSGDGGLNHSIKAMADLIEGLHGKLADRLDDHGDKVDYAHDSFGRHDVDVHGAFEDLMKDMD